MISQSTVKPKSFEVDKFGDECHISLFVDPVLKEDPDEGPYYYYDYYKITLPYRHGIEEEVGSNYQEWVEFAKGKAEEPRQETEKEKILRLEAENAELGGVVEDLVSALIEKGVVY
jgi:hypothetical protein